MIGCFILFYLCDFLYCRAHPFCLCLTMIDFTREQLLIQVMLLTDETERGANWEFELGIYYVLMIYLELVITF